MGDLREKGAGRAEDQDRLVAGLLSEEARDLSRRLGEVGRDGDVRLPGFGLRRKRSQERDTCGCKGG